MSPVSASRTLRFVPRRDGDQDPRHAAGEAGQSLDVGERGDNERALDCGADLVAVQDRRHRHSLDRRLAGREHHELPAPSPELCGERLGHQQRVGKARTEAAAEAVHERAARRRHSVRDAHERDVRMAVRSGDPDALLEDRRGDPHAVDQPHAFDEPLVEPA